MKVIISVISDLVTDQRVHKTAQLLHEEGYEVLLLGRKLHHSAAMSPKDYQYKRVKLPFETGPLFYASYTIWNFFFLLFHKADILHANDLDTLLPNFLVSKIKNIPLVYDSHEYFTGVPEIQDRKMVKYIWTVLEQFIFPKLKHVYTVNESIAQKYEAQYKVKVGVVRNVPFLLEVNKHDQLHDLPVAATIVYQGALNVDRGLEEMILAMQFIDQAKLMIIGVGDVEKQLHELVRVNQLTDKVVFKGRLKYDEMMQVTKLCTLGISIEKPTNDNYKLCLPNKLFDYLHVGVPVIASRLVEVAAVINRYEVGGFIDNHDPRHIASCINLILHDQVLLSKWKKNTMAARLACNWQDESGLIKKIYAKL
jgi:glycosyltransferase involved in cell wall biosynthesis